MSNYHPALLEKTDNEGLLWAAPHKRIREQLALFLCGQGKASFALPTAHHFFLALDINRATLLRSALASSRWSGPANSTDPTAFAISEEFFPSVTILKSATETPDSSRKIVCSPSSSTEPPIIWKLEHINEIEILFETARGEVFEYGAESSFSKDLVSIVQKHGNVAILEIAYLITHEKADPEVAHEALRWLGRLTDTDTHDFRLWLLKHSLCSSSAKIRDGAIQGLAFLGDLAAKPVLVEAAQREQIVFLKAYMAKVVATLDQKKQWASS